jgi:DNA polymerase-3 subunit delta'
VTTFALVQVAAVTPALGTRKVFVIGDAERMVSQTGSDEAANAFMKLLEEPPDDTTIILTSSAPGALLPTIRSRVAAVRVAPLPADDVRAWIRVPRVQAALDKAGLPAREHDRVQAVAGAPGSVLSPAGADATGPARLLLEAARGGSADRAYAAALRLGSMGARGGFSVTLAELARLLGEEMRQAVARGDAAGARASAAGIGDVEWARERAENNANPQLVGAELVRRLAGAARN